jgi:hypothetical protein
VDLKERMSQVVDLMKTTKAEWVAQNPEDTDLAIYLHFWRDDFMVAAVQVPLDRDKALHAGRIAATGFGADAMSVAFESYHTELKESPLTGKPWRHHEMQYVAETHPEAREKGWVNECITITMHERGGDFALHSIPYLIKEDHVEWQEAQTQTVDSTVEGEGSGGVMFDYLQDAMSQPRLMDLIAEKAPTDEMAAFMLSLVDDAEAQQFHADVGTLKAMEGQGLASGFVLFAEEGSKREKLIEERLGPEGFIKED